MTPILDLEQDRQPITLPAGLGFLLSARNQRFEAILIGQ
jgi:hypothetical protein